MGELSVKVAIANRSYPLRIQKEEEQDILNAAQQINKRMKEIEDNYAVKDKQDLLAMCALQMLTENKDHHAVKGSKDTFSKKLNEIDRMLSDYLDANDD